MTNLTLPYLWLPIWLTILTWQRNQQSKLTASKSSVSQNGKNPYSSKIVGIVGIVGSCRTCFKKAILKKHRKHILKGGSICYSLSFPISSKTGYYIQENCINLLSLAPAAVLYIIRHIIYSLCLYLLLENSSENWLTKLLYLPFLLFKLIISALIINRAILILFVFTSYIFFHILMYSSFFWPPDMEY